MSVSVTVRGNPININKGNILLYDIDQLRTNEINRRRKLRIQQVRQQSKDIASMIRERVRDEAARHLTTFEHKQIAELKKLQSEKLRCLQQQYQDCLQQIGTGHEQAALQPDAATELAKQREISHAIAQDRGRDAATKLRQEKTVIEEQKNAEKKMHKYSRTIEDLRSAMVVSLGKKTSKKSKSPKERQHKKMPLQELSSNIMLEPEQLYEPKKLKVTVKPHCKYCSNTECICMCAKQNNRRLRQPLPGEEGRRGNSIYSPILPSNIPSSPAVAEDSETICTSSFKEICVPDEQVSSAYEKSNEGDDKSEGNSSVPSLTHPKPWRLFKYDKLQTDDATDSQSNDVKTTSGDELCSIHSKNDEVLEEDYDSSSSSDTSSTCTCLVEPCHCSHLTALRPCGRKVQFYDHGNRFKSEYRSYPRVERHLFANSEPDAHKAAQMQEAIGSRSVPKNAQEALKRVRGNQALMREKVSRDYKELLLKLSSLAREERLTRSNPVNSLPVEAYLTDWRQKEIANKRQKQMDAMFENVCSDIIPQQPTQSPSVQEAEPTKPACPEVEESPLKLNVAQCKNVLPRKQASPVKEEIPIKEDDGKEDIHKTTVRKPTLKDLFEHVDMQRSLLLDELGAFTAPCTESHDSSMSAPVQAHTHISKAEKTLQSIHESLLSSLSNVSPVSIESTPNKHGPESEGQPANDSSKVEIHYEGECLDETVLEKEPKRESVLNTNVNENISKKDIKIKKVLENKHYKKKSRKSKQPKEKSMEKDNKNSSSSSAVTVNEYSIDLSRSRTVEQSFDNGVESFNSSTSAYEEVKIIVSVTERAEEIPSKSPNKKKRQKSSKITASPNKSQKQQRHSVVTEKLQNSHHDKITKITPKTVPSNKTKSVARKLPQEKLINSKEKKTKDATAQTYGGHTHTKSPKWQERLRISNSSFSNKHDSDIRASYINVPEHIFKDKIDDMNELQPDTGKEVESKITKPVLSCYISRLLTMSRESIEDLNVSSSDVSSLSLKSVKINAAIQTEGDIDNAAKEIESKKLCPQAKVKSLPSVDTAEDEKTRMLHAEMQLFHDFEDFKSIPAESSSINSTPESHPLQLRGVKEMEQHSQSAQNEHFLGTSSRLNHRGEKALIEEDKAITKEKISIQETKDQGLSTSGLKSTSASNGTSLPMEDHEFGKYPQLLASMTETCLRNISNLNKSIEQIRMEKKKIIEMSFSGSGSSSNGNDNDNNRSNNSTRYRSPPSTSSIMAPTKPKEMSKSPIEEILPIVTSTPYNFGRPPHSHLQSCLEKCSCCICENEAKPSPLFKHQEQIYQSPNTWRKALSRNGNAAFIRDLSTIFEVDSNISSQQHEFSKDSDKSPSRKEKGESKNNIQSGNAESDDESLPDVMSEMLKRGLISSPLSWSKNSAVDTNSPNHKTSVSSSSEEHEQQDVDNNTKDRNYIYHSAPRILQTVQQMGSNPTPEERKEFFENFGIEWEDVISCFKSDYSDKVYDWPNHDNSFLLHQTIATPLRGHKGPLRSKKKVSLQRDCESEGSSSELSPTHSDIMEIICKTCNRMLAKCTCDLLPDIPSSENLTSDSF